MRVLGKQRVAEWKPCLEGLQQDCGALWIGLQVCLAWFPFHGAWFEGILAGTQLGEYCFIVAELDFLDSETLCGCPWKQNPSSAHLLFPFRLGLQRF